ncbi:MAG: hypothetical protein AAGD11_09265 [Planctomycetota bacterium]
MRNSKQMKAESLESRICLAASAVVDDGDLVISGDAEGDIEIVAVGAGLYQVSEGGVVIADSSELQGVTDDIRISLEETIEATNDNVTIDLGEEVVDRIYADLGEGDNSLTVTGGSARSFFYRGGDGADDVQLSTTIDSWAWVRLRDGDDTLTVDGDIGRLYVAAGGGDDMVFLTDTSTLDYASLRLGNGDNEVVHSGSIDGRLRVAAGDGDDIVTIDENATVEGNVHLRLGDGANTATVNGILGGSFSFTGRDGDDTLTVAQSADVADNIYARLGEGDNSASIEATVGADVNVTSTNSDDETRISVTEGSVAGDVNLTPGEQSAGYYHFRSGRGRIFRAFRFARR